MNSPVLRTLLGIAGLYATACAGCYLFLSWYRPPPPGHDNFWTTALLAIPFAAALGYLVGAPRYRQEERLLLHALERPRLEDGQRVAAIGPVEALDTPLTSPFSGKACVAYQYEIDHEVRHVDRPPTRVRDFWGMAVSPYQVQTAAGPVRILGYARLEGAPRVLDGEDAYRAAETYVNRTRFRYPTSAGERYGSLAEPLTIESDTFGDDICALSSAATLGSGELRKLQLSESCLEVGQAVCAVGYYSAAKNALVPTTRGTKRLRISTFGPEAWAEENRRWARTYYRWGIGMAVLGVGCALATRWC